MSEPVLHEGHAELVALFREQFQMLKAGASSAMARRLARTEEVLLGVLADEARRTDDVARDNLDLQRRVEELEELVPVELRPPWPEPQGVS